MAIERIQIGLTYGGNEGSETRLNRLLNEGYQVINQGSFAYDGEVSEFFTLYKKDPVPNLLIKSGEHCFFEGDKVLVPNPKGELFVLKITHLLGDRLVATTDWYRHEDKPEAFVPLSRAYFDYVKEHGDIDVHPHSGEVITEENHERISKEIKELNDYDKSTRTDV